MDAQVAEGMIFDFKSHGTRRLLRNHASLVVLLQLLLDTLLVLGLIWGLAEWHTGEFGPQYRIFAVLSLLLMWVVYRYQGIYRRFSSVGQSLIRLGMAWGLVLGALLVIAFATKTSEDYSRLVLGLWAVGGYVGQLLIHASLYRTVRVYQQYCADRLPVLVVGTRHLAARCLTGWLGL